MSEDLVITTAGKRRPSLIFPAVVALSVGAASSLFFWGLAVRNSVGVLELELQKSHTLKPVEN